MNTKELKKSLNKLKKKKQLAADFYSIRSILGYANWAMLYFLLGGREAGKSYATTKFFVEQWKKYKRPFIWLRLSDASSRKLLENNAEKLIDPDLRRKYNIEIERSSDCVYEIKRDEDGKITSKELMARVLNLSTFYNDKGSGLFDSEFLNDPNMYYNICLDEMNREKNERKTFDITYAFVNELENLIRSTKNRIRVICIGNTLEEASDILSALNFLPESFGRFKLVKNKKILTQYLRELNMCKNFKERSIVDEKYKDYDFGKRAVIEYIEPSEKYLNRRKGTIANILTPDASTFTNEIKSDIALINKKRLNRPTNIIAFGENKNEKFTVWDGRTIKEYHNEKVTIISMKPYLPYVFNTDQRNNVYAMFDARYFYFRDLITQKLFKKALELTKPRK